MPKLMPKVVNIELTNHCNARCASCTNHFMKRERGYMDFTVFKSIIAKLAPCEEIEMLQFQGHGESFLHSSIEKFLDYARMKCPNKKLSIVTNGSLIKSVPASLDYAVVSFNGGNKNTYESMMGLDFDKTLANIKQIKPKDKLHIQMLVCRSNEDTREEFDQLWQGWYHSMQPGYHNYMGRIPDDAIYKLVVQKPCNRLIIHLSILWDGQVNLCCLDYENESPVGNILKESVEDIYNNGVLSKKREEQNNGIWSDVCEKCTTCCYA